MTSKPINSHCLVVRSRLPKDPLAEALLEDAHALNLKAVKKIERRDLYFIEGELSDAERKRLCAELLTDPVAQRGEWRVGKSKPPAGAFLVEAALRPGVTDPVAEHIVHYAHVLGIAGVERAATGQSYLVHGRLKTKDLHMLAKRLLANDVIQRYAIGAIQPIFPHPAEATGDVEILPVRGLDDKGLLALSRDRRAALDLQELRAIQEYFEKEGRDPTDVELEMIAQTWSEHCGHKTFRAQIQVMGETKPVDGLLKTYLREATRQIGARWVRSAFVDNAGIIDFDGEYEVSFKVETHNHPSAIEPFGGANTGVGGVIRDVLGVSGTPIAATDVLCFGPQDADPELLPEGVLHPRRIRSGVVAGVQDYGNKIGLPTVGGAIWYDPAFTSNPLVYCGCVGIAPRGSHPNGARENDHIIVLGGRTGRDGLRGATFSSMTMDAQTGEVSGASVQIGDPITEKGLIEVIVRARKRRLYNAITDCGAGGLSSAVGEMSSRGGADVELKQVPLKYGGLAPWEIWLSEAQERMVLAVPAEHLEELRRICEIFDVMMVDIGHFNHTGHIAVHYAGKTVLELKNKFLHDSQPRRTLQAVLPVRKDAPAAFRYPDLDSSQTLLQLLAHPNIASKADIIRRYDHEVQGATAVKPLLGVENDGPSDGCVLKPLVAKSRKAIVLSHGFNPEFGKTDAYRMALSVIDEAIRNAVALGADPSRIGILDNFCWGDPLRPETLGSLVQACRGCHEAALHYRTPFISGKDSLNNEYIGSDGKRHAIPPSLLISAIGILDDVENAVTMDLKGGGNIIYLIGETRKELGGSHLHIVQPGLPESILDNSAVPGLPMQAPELYRALHAAMKQRLVQSCHDLSEGGLAVAAAEMSIAGRFGMALTVDMIDPVVALFSESNGRLLAEVKPDNCERFERFFSRELKQFVQPIGNTTPGRWLSISSRDQNLINLPVDVMLEAWLGDAIR